MKDGDRGHGEGVTKQVARSACDSQGASGSGGARAMRKSASALDPAGARRGWRSPAGGTVPQISSGPPVGGCDETDRLDTREGSVADAGQRRALTQSGDNRVRRARAEEGLPPPRIPWPTKPDRCQIQRVPQGPVSSSRQVAGDPARAGAAAVDINLSWGQPSHEGVYDVGRPPRTVTTNVSSIEKTPFLVEAKQAASRIRNVRRSGPAIIGIAARA